MRYRCRRVMVGVMVAALTCGIVASAGAADYDDSWDDDDAGHPVIVWVGSVATNVFYLPAKILYAATGGFIGSLGWVWSGGDGDAAWKVWDPTIRGTYLVTPSMLEGHEEVRFIGP